MRWLGTQSPSSPMPAVVLRVGAISSVGDDAPSTFAALRTRTNNFTESVVLDSKKEPVLVGLVPRSLLRQSDLGVQITDPVQLHVALATKAVQECLNNPSTTLPLPPIKSIPLLVCTSELRRPGRPANLDQYLMDGLQKSLGCGFTEPSAVYAYGQCGITMALNDALSMLNKHPFVLVVGVDSFVHFSSLAALLKRELVLTTENTDGFIPGEAACALLLGRPDAVSHWPAVVSTRTRSTARSLLPSHKNQGLMATALCMSREPALEGSGQPIRGEGFRQAIRGSLESAKQSPSESHWCICSNISDDQSAKELALGTARAGTTASPLWCLADSLGETGAAAGPLALAWAYAAHHKGYAPSETSLALLSSPEGERSSTVLRFGKFTL